MEITDDLYEPPQGASRLSFRNSGGDTVHVGADLYAPPRIDLKVTGAEYAADVEAVLMLEGRHYVVQDLHITRQEGGPPITSKLIRKIAVQDLIRGVVSDSVSKDDSPSRANDVFGKASFVLTPEERERLVAAGPTDEMLLWVARTYYLAELTSEPPAKSVGVTFGIPMSTANVWIRRAKDRKILNG